MINVLGYNEVEIKVGSSDVVEVYKGEDLIFKKEIYTKIFGHKDVKVPLPSSNLFSSVYGYNLNDLFVLGRKYKIVIYKESTQTEEFRLIDENFSFIINEKTGLTNFKEKESGVYEFYYKPTNYTKTIYIRSVGDIENNEIDGFEIYELIN